MKKNTSILNSLYLRIALTFLALLVVIGFAYVIITVYYSRIYFQHVNQRLNHGLAANIVTSYPSLHSQQIDQENLDQIFRHAMSINPNLEIYLLDSTGNIISYAPREKKIVLAKVNLTMIRDFLQKKESKYITGDDPRNPELKKVFSAAAIVREGEAIGYLYVVLTGEDYDAASRSLLSNFFFELGFGAMIWTLIVAFIVGLIVFRILTKNFRELIEVMQKFKDGELTARVDVRSPGEAKILADLFNEMADILTANIEKLKTVEILRRELIGNISHDLRTPLSIIHGYIETLQMKDKSLTVEEREHYMNIILESTIGLKKMVNELVELSKLEANQVHPDKEPFNISELLNDIAQKYQLIAKEKNISIMAGLSHNLPPVFADVSLIERVIQNLLDNAIKSTPPGGKIYISTSRVDDKLQVSISDTGSGISLSERERILGQSNKTEDASGLKTSTGLGLAIVRKILELHDSSLQLDYNIPTGSIFGFKLSMYKN
ncbi:MAG: HAMP domain-containing histidine kinase [Chitinophagaceae bacterium]|nr:HAMP domain-containing histidine kinase [Chitinophagaceae bacterium]